MLTKELAHKLQTLTNSQQWLHLVEYLNKVQEQTTQEMAKSHNLQIIHQCQGRWNFLERLKNLPSQVNDLRNSVDE